MLVMEARKSRQSDTGEEAQLDPARAGLEGQGGRSAASECGKLRLLCLCDSASVSRVLAMLRSDICGELTNNAVAPANAGGVAVAAAEAAEAEAEEEAEAEAEASASSACSGASVSSQTSTRACEVEIEFRGCGLLCNSLPSDNEGLPTAAAGAFSLLLECSETTATASVEASATIAGQEDGCSLVCGRCLFLCACQACVSKAARFFQAASRDWRGKPASNAVPKAAAMDAPSPDDVTSSRCCSALEWSCRRCTHCSMCASRLRACAMSSEHTPDSSARPKAAAKVAVSSEERTEARSASSNASSRSWRPRNRSSCSRADSSKSSCTPASLARATAAAKLSVAAAKHGES
mmetsp:Transcript_75414/g.212397  ORF Transcript_75414/g.212397 Transcript_75414/m.212397 type:complete len:350 (+) Transcript_75414:664-1713(+)